MVGSSPISFRIKQRLAVWPALYATDDGKHVLAQMFLFLVNVEIANRSADWLDVEPGFVVDMTTRTVHFSFPSFTRRSLNLYSPNQPSKLLAMR